MPRVIPGRKTPDKQVKSMLSDSGAALSFPVVGVGAATEGLEAFLDLLTLVPLENGSAFVLILHSSQKSDAAINRIIVERTRIPVRQISNGLRIKSDHIYVARRNQTVTINGKTFHATDSTVPPDRHRPVDVFFQSLAATQREMAICVILSGTGSDGTLGAQVVRASGGFCLAQLQASAQCASMSRSIVDAGLADFVLPPREIAGVIMRLGRHSQMTGSRSLNRETESDRQALSHILGLLRNRVLHDFSEYNRASLIRRIQRRMGLGQIEGMPDYALHLQQTPGETQILADEILAHATNFFRDPETWDNLRRQVIEPLISERHSGSVIRAWVPACATGEEAYSLAMLLWESTEAAGKTFDMQLFATDASGHSLNRARSGLYPGVIDNEISPERLHRFFEPVESSFRINKKLREMVVFAAHDVLHDPPFSDVDICVCRNLLVRLEPDGQQRTLAQISFGLRTGGVLMVGKNETIPSIDEFLQPLDGQPCFFRRLDSGKKTNGATRPPSSGFSKPTRGAQNLVPKDKVIEHQASSDAKRAPNREPISIKEEVLTLDEEMTRTNALLHAKMEELEGSINDMSSLLSSTDIAVVFLDLNLRVRRHTPAASELFEHTPRITGLSLREVPLKFADPTLHDDVNTVLGNHQPMETEVMNVSGRTYIRRVLPYRTIDNRPDGIVLTFVDITQRKLAESALRTNEAQYRLVLQGIKEYAIFLLDREGRVASWAAGAERIFGYNEADILGQHLHIIHTPEDRMAQMAEKELKQADKSNTVFVERWHVRKDGSKFWGTGTLSNFLDESGRSYGFVKVVRDNTDRKFFEEALKQAKMYAENANASKDYFLANVSHELRTPLASIMLWSKLLVTHQSPDSSLLKEGLAAIDKCSKEQQALIEDLMDTSRIVAGKLRLEIGETDLNRLIRDATAAIRPVAMEKDLSLDEMLDPDVGTVKADPRRLRQVLMNVLNNAVKFTPSGGHISVKSERIGSIVEIHVTDTGQGISEEFISRVFERYMQIDPSNVPTSGSMGLGLAIARQLVESHGGTIRAKSGGTGKGTTFSIRIHLPRIKPTPDAPISGPNRTISLAGLRILLVEDDTATRKALTAVLTEAGAAVISVDAATPALYSFEQQSPDLILSDIGLGKINGHELIRQIRGRENARKTRLVPAIALTAYADEKNRLTALESGFQECLTKPVEPLFLLSILAGLRVNR